MEDAIELPVESSNIAKLHYSIGLQKLVVTFRKGLVYEYADVPIDIWESLVAAPSKGTYLAKAIRDKYQFKKIEATE